MSSEELHVLLGERVAGTLTRTSRNQLSFAYDGEYANSPTATPLSISMPTQIPTHRGSSVNAWLWGLLPDDAQVRDRWGRHFQVSTASPFSLLATPLGEDCPGAVRFVGPDRLDAVLDEDAAHRDGDSPEEDLRWLDEDDVANLLRGLLRDHTAWLGANFSGRFSLAGVQAKTALLDHDGKWAEPNGRFATSHILKPAISGLDEHDLNEHLCLLAMRHAGLPVVRTRLARFDDVTAVVVARYDRLGHGLRRRRLHQEDMCQALGLRPDMKYQSDGGPSPEDVAGLIRRTHPGRAASAAIRTFLDALIWNWIIGGTDAHAKNYSLLLAGPEVRLAPLYDIASALPYDTAEQRLRLAMKFGSDYRLNPGGSPWKHLARATRMNEEEVRHRAGAALDAAPEAFAAAAADPDVAALASGLPDRLAALVEKRSVRCREVLERS